MDSTVRSLLSIKSREGLTDKLQFGGLTSMAPCNLISSCWRRRWWLHHSKPRRAAARYCWWPLPARRRRLAATLDRAAQTHAWTSSICGVVFGFAANALEPTFARHTSSKCLWWRRSRPSDEVKCSTARRLQTARKWCLGCKSSG